MAGFYAWNAGRRTSRASVDSRVDGRSDRQCATADGDDGESAEEGEAGAVGVDLIAPALVLGDQLPTLAGLVGLHLARHDPFDALDELGQLALDAAHAGLERVEPQLVQLGRVVLVLLDAGDRLSERRESLV